MRRWVVILGADAGNPATSSTSPVPGAASTTSSTVKR